jgi:hypothetical protein
LVLNTITGNLTCPTCATTTSGGALSALPPLSLSAGGALSITGVAGQVLAGSTPAFTATPVLGVAGSIVGSLGFQNASTGTITLQPATGALGSSTLTLPAATDQLTGQATTDTLTNKTLTSSTNTLGGVTMTLGSDATGDIYYRSGGVLTRLPIGGAATVLTVSGGIPAWVSPTGGGNVSNTGTPTVGQFAQWTNATTVQGFSLVITPQGRLTLQSGTPVQTTDQTAKAQVFYDCASGSLVPYYNGTTDVLDTIASCQVSFTMVSGAATGGVNANDVFDVYWVHSGANRVCIVTNGGTGASGAGWSGDTGGSTTARGSGYSAVSNTRGYYTNPNSITHCYNGSTDYGPVSANQGTFLGTLYTTAAGQTSMMIHPAPASGGPNSFLAVWNAYNRVYIHANADDNGTTYTYSSATPRQFRASANNRIQWVDGLAQSIVKCQATNTGIAVSGTSNVTIGCGLDVANAITGISGYTQVGTALNASSSGWDTNYGLFGIHAYNAIEAAAAAGTTFTANGNSTGMILDIQM